MGWVLVDSDDVHVVAAARAEGKEKILAIIDED